MKCLSLKLSLKLIRNTEIQSYSHLILFNIFKKIAGYDYIYSLRSICYMTQKKETEL